MQHTSAKLLLSFILLIPLELVSQVINAPPQTNALSVQGDVKYVKNATMKGNTISTIIYNTGAIGRPGVASNVLDLAWNGLGYATEIGLLLGAEVKDTSGNTVHSVSEGFYTTSDGEYGLDGTKWGWLPVAGYAKSNQTHIATSTDPSTWDSTWTEWPGRYQPGKPSADLETFYGMDDLTKKDFAYVPFPQDSTKRGLGLKPEVRCYQFADAKLADVFFTVIDVKNISKKKLSKMVAGLFFDLHVGGASNYADDATQFDAKRGMTYSWDPDGVSEIPSIPPGYIGIMFPETPGNPNDGIDNDGDGMVDESPSNGIDDDHDWNPLTDDVGADGIPNTHDAGEGDSVPTHGEPNFDEKDRDEVDQLGTTSFSNLSYGGNNRPKNDALMWTTMVPGTFGTNLLYPPSLIDGVGVMGSGYFALDSNMTATLGVAFIFAGNYDTLIQRADLVAKEYPKRFTYAIGGNTVGLDRTQEVPALFSLEQNYPNPFNPGTVISYQLSLSGFVTLKVFDVLGREVSTLVNEKQSAGPHEYRLSMAGSNLTSGIYFYELRSGSFVETKKMVFVK